jgi:hypothetical protein
MGVEAVILIFLIGIKFLNRGQALSVTGRLSVLVRSSTALLFLIWSAYSTGIRLPTLGF